MLAFSLPTFLLPAKLILQLTKLSPRRTFKSYHLQDSEKHFPEFSFCVCLLATINWVWLLTTRYGTIQYDKKKRATLVQSLQLLNLTSNILIVTDFQPRRHGDKLVRFEKTHLSWRTWPIAWREQCGHHLLARVENAKCLFRLHVLTKLWNIHINIPIEKRMKF